MTVVDTTFRNSSSATATDGNILRQVNFWKQRIESAKKLKTYQDFKETKDYAKSFYRGEQVSESERESWEGDLVQSNIFRRLVNFMFDTIFAVNPNIKVQTRIKSDNLQWTSTVETHLRYIFEECDIRSEVRRVLKDSYFGNLSTAKIDYDRVRGLWRAKWVAGELICDPDAYGDLSRARWIAEHVQIPRYRVYQDTTFDAQAREEIKTKQQSQDFSYNELNNFNKDLENIWYIYTKEGIDPVTGEEPNKLWLLVYAEDYDKWLLQVPNPCPYLNEDEFPYSILRLDEIPGEFIGPALWKLVEPTVKAFNWACSYHFTDMRKTASRPIGYDEDRVSDPELLKSRKHMVLIPTKGAPADSISPLNVGQADKTIYQSIEFFYQLLDKLTGIDEIARGEEGRMKTATESQILQQNSNIALRGPAMALDAFLNDMIRKIGLASLYYTPAFSIFQDQSGQFVTKQLVPTPILAPNGLPTVDPTGQVATQMQLQVIPVEATEPVKGIDYFHGEQAALQWPQLPFEEIANEIHFTIEAGSTRVEKRLEKQQNATTLLQTIGAELRQLGLWENYYELLSQYVSSFEMQNMNKILPSKEVFLQATQLQQQMMAMAQSDQGGAAGAAKQPQMPQGGINKAGTDFPLNEAVNEGKDQSSGT